MLFNASEKGGSIKTLRDNRIEFFFVKMIIDSVRQRFFEEYHASFYRSSFDDKAEFIGTWIDEWREKNGITWGTR